MDTGKPPAPKIALQGETVGEFTLPETNSLPLKIMFFFPSSESPFPGVYFQGCHVSFRGYVLVILP